MISSLLQQFFFTWQASHVVSGNGLRHYLYPLLVENKSYGYFCVSYSKWCQPHVGLLNELILEPTLVQTADIC